MLQNSEQLKQVGDTTAIGAAMASFFELLPAVLSNISALFALVYLLIRIYETKTVQKWLRKNWRR